MHTQAQRKCAQVVVVVVVVCVCVCVCVCVFVFVPTVCAQRVYVCMPLTNTEGRSSFSNLQSYLRGGGTGPPPLHPTPKNHVHV